MGMWEKLMAGHTGQDTHTGEDTQVKTHTQVRTHRVNVFHSGTWNLFQAMKVDKDGVRFRFQKKSLKFNPGTWMTEGNPGDKLVRGS